MLGSKKIINQNWGYVTYLIGITMGVMNITEGW